MPVRPSTPGAARPFRPSRVETRLGRVEIATHGDGPVVLAVHGGMGGYDQGLLLARAALAGRGYRVIAVSRPGYLGMPLGDARGPERQAELCAALLDALGIDRAIVLAISAGGLAALQFALRHPERCRALVMISACSGRMQTPPDVMKRLAVMRVLARLPWFGALLRWRVQRDPEAAARRSIPDDAMRERTLRHAEAGPMLTSLMSGVFDRLARRLPGTENDIAQCAAAESYPLARIGVPTLAIHGRCDRVVPFTHAEAVSREVSGARMLALEDGGHVCLFTHLDEVRAGVREFLAASAWT